MFSVVYFLCFLFAILIEFGPSLVVLSQQNQNRTNIMFESEMLLAQYVIWMYDILNRTVDWNNSNVGIWYSMLVHTVVFLSFIAFSLVCIVIRNIWLSVCFCAKLSVVFFASILRYMHNLYISFLFFRTNHNPNKIKWDFNVLFPSNPITTFIVLLVFWITKTKLKLKQYVNRQRN